MSRRLSPKEIKEDIRHDEIRSTLEVTLDWIATNRKAVLIGLIAFFVLLLAGSGFATYLEHRSDVASAKLAQAMETYEAPVVSGDDEVPVGVDQTFDSDEARLAAAKTAFDEVGGLGAGAAGEVADLYRATIAAREGRNDEARKLWQAFVDDHGGHALAVGARINLIHLDRAEGKGEEVASRLETEMASFGGELPEDVMLYELGLTYEELDRTEDAVDTFQRLVDEHPTSPYAGPARQRL